MDIDEEYKINANITINVNIGDKSIEKTLKEILEKLSFITNQNKQIIMTQAEVAQRLIDLKNQADKINAEVQANFDALKQAIANAGNATPEVESALSDLGASIQKVDDINPDTLVP